MGDFRLSGGLEWVTGISSFGASAVGIAVLMDDHLAWQNGWIGGIAMGLAVAAIAAAPLTHAARRISSRITYRFATAITAVLAAVLAFWQVTYMGAVPPGN